MRIGRKVRNTKNECKNSRRKIKRKKMLMQHLEIVSSILHHLQRLIQEYQMHLIDLVDKQFVEELI
jgi:hypothetical protein